MKDENNQPLISVIVPTCERGNLLTRALDSIYAQTWENIEVVVVDDNILGSKWEKETYRVLKPYIERKNFVYIKTEGKTGGGTSRNLAIRQCRGEYVAFLDDDDRYLPDKLEKQLRFIRENDLDGSYHDVRWFNEKEQQVEYRSMDYTEDFSRNGLLKAHILHSICPTAIYMFRREMLLKTSGFGEVPSGQDFILMLRCIESGMRLGYMSGAYVIQYLHRGERVSLGEGKIRGENMLYELKHKYFYLLSDQECVYVKFRHNAVLAFASFRSRRPVQAARYAVVTLKTSPRFCVKEAVRYFKSKFRRK